MTTLARTECRTGAGDFIDVLDYDAARPLLFRPEARRQFLAEHGYQVETS